MTTSLPSMHLFLSVVRKAESSGPQSMVSGIASSSENSLVCKSSGPTPESETWGSQSSNLHFDHPFMVLMYTQVSDLPEKRLGAHAGSKVTLHSGVRRCDSMSYLGHLLAVLNLSGLSLLIVTLCGFYKDQRS